MNRLNLIVPGLLGPFSSELSVYTQQQLKQPHFQKTSQWLSRADVSSISAGNYFETLVSEIFPQCDSGACQLSAMMDAIDLSQGYYYRADPVHFKAESDHAVLLGSELISPGIEESQQLIDAFNQHFKEDCLSLHASHAERWYLRSEKPLDLKFHALDYALGRDIKHFMPYGEDELWWRKIINEAQMLFFQHDVNQQRDITGQLSINGLWLWDLPVATEEYESNHLASDQLQIYTDDVIAMALAKQCGAKTKPLDGFPEKEGLVEDNMLITDQLYAAVCYGDETAWLESLQEFCQGTLLQVSELLKSKKIDDVYIYPCDGRVFRVDRGRLMKFWKSVKTIDQFVIAD